MMDRNKLFIISLIFYLNLNLAISQTVNKNQQPIIKVVSVEVKTKLKNKTEIVESHKNPESLLNSQNVMNLKFQFAKIYIECTANFPLKWTFKGQTAPLQVNFTSFRKFENETEKFIAEFHIVRVSAPITGEWTCQDVQNSDIKTVIYIFAEENGYRGTDADPFFIDFGKHWPIFARLNEEVVFPCVSWKADLQARLAKKVPENGESGRMVYKDVESSLAKFDPTKGFTLTLAQPDPWGNYLCYSILNKTFDRISILLQEKFDVMVSPANKTLEFFEDSQMDLKCTTNDTRLVIKMIYDFPQDSRIEFSNDTKSIFLAFRNLSLNDNGKVICSATLEGRPVFEHEWSFQVISETDKKRRGWKYYFSKRTQKHTYACWTRSSNVPSVAFVRCTNPMECAVRSSCFKLENRCDEIEARACSGGCALLPVTNKPGILTCTGDGVKDAIVNLYIGVSNKTYNKSGELLEDSLKLSIDSGNGNETYSGSIIQLQCVGSSFHFARGFYWTIQLKNDTNWGGEEFRVDNNTRNVNGVARLVDFDEHFIETGLIVLTSRIKILTTGISHISCVAPHWDSFKNNFSTINFTVKEPTLPSFDKGTEDVDLYLGDNNVTIRCIAQGVPQPKISWTKNGEPIANTVAVINGGDTLHLAEVAHSHQGTYECSAVNSGGLVEKHFKLYITDPKQKVIVWVSVCGVIGILLLLALLALFWRRIQRQKALLRNLTDAEIEEFLYGNPDAIDRSEDTNKQAHLLAYNRDYEFPKDYLNIQMEEKLGSGAYGLVLKGVARGLFPDEEETVVAIKTLQPNADISNFKALLIELKIMSVIGRHAHIVNLLGACTTDIRQREVYIIVEYCENGSLEKYLKAHRPDFGNFHSTARYSIEPQRATVMYENQPQVQSSRINVKTLLKWCCEVASGMEYLSSKKIIHGDIAARNVLIDSKLFAKIGDFGLSRQLYEYTNYVKKQQAPLPWRWMAIESLCDMEFSCKSDVWSYGITLWEIFSLGEIPYPGTSWTEEFIRKLRQGNRPPKPDLAEDSVYNIMIECWRYDPADRPTFSELVLFFRNHLYQKGVLVQEPSPPPIRHKFNLQINNGAYGICKEIKVET